MQHTSIDKTITPDAKGRITLGVLAKNVSSFHVSVDESGRIVLDPYVEIPAREHWLYQNKAAMKQVLTGLAQAKAGKTTSLGDFSQYLDDES